MFDDILIPVDGSDTAWDAAEMGLELAAEHDATVHGLYVVEPVPMGEAGGAQVVESMQAAGDRIVSEFADRAEARGLSVVTAVESGTAQGRIRKYSDDNAIDLVVMGTHGRTGIGRYFLGSVTERVVRLSDVPVLTVQASSDAQE